MLSFAIAHYRCQQHQSAAFGHGQHGVHHLRDRLCFQRHTVRRASRISHPSEQQAEVVINFSDGAYGGARIVRGRFLFNGDSGGQPLDMIDIGLFHHRQELSSVGRE